MYKVNINKGQSINVELKNNEWFVNHDLFDGKMVKDGNIFHIRHQFKNYQLEILHFNKENRVASIRINGCVMQCNFQTATDILLEKLGINNGATKKAKDLKAPMPGMVLRVLVEEGQEVAEGTPLIVLESMKMENVIKSPGAGVIDKIKCQQGTSIEKNSTLITFKS